MIKPRIKPLINRLQLERQVYLGLDLGGISAFWIYLVNPSMTDELLRSESQLPGIGWMLLPLLVFPLLKEFFWQETVRSDTLTNKYLIFVHCLLLVWFYLAMPTW